MVFLLTQGVLSRSELCTKTLLEQKNKEEEAHLFTVMWLWSVVWILKGDRRKMYLFAASQISHQLLKRHKTYM